MSGETEGPHVQAIAAAYHTLQQEHGWRAAMYAPLNTPLQLIEAGSTGIHSGYRDDLGFWISDTETWPSNAILFRLAVQKV